MEQLKTYWESYSATIIQVGYNLLLAIVVLIVTRLLVALVRKSIRQAEGRVQRYDSTLTPLLSSVTAYAIYGIGLVVVLDIFGVNTNSIIALLGAMGIAIGLALKDTLSNIAAGIMLLILRPFRAGHFIEAGSFSGTVKEIGLFTTVMETADGQFLSMPNSSLWNVPIKNSTCNGKRRMDLVVGIAYGDSIDTAFNLLREIVTGDSRFLTDPAPQIMVRDLGDSSVNIQLRAWAKVEDYWTLYWEHNKIIKEKIEAAGLTVPFPQLDLHLDRRE